MKISQSTLMRCIILMLLIISAPNTSVAFLAGATSYNLQEGSIIELGSAMISQSHRYTMLELFQRDEVYKAELVEEDAPISLIYTSFSDEENDLMFYVHSSDKNGPDWSIDIFQGAEAFLLGSHNNGVQKELWTFLNTNGDYVEVCVWELGDTRASICISQKLKDNDLIFEILLPYSEPVYNHIYGSIRYLIDNGIINSLGD